MDFRNKSGKRSAEIPLSYAQLGTWEFSRSNRQERTFAIRITAVLRGMLHEAALESALKDLVRRHESLRTVLLEASPVPEQRAEDVPCRPLLTVIPAARDELAQHLRTAALDRFALFSEIPIRASLFRISAELHVLLLLVHQLAIDRWSVAPLARDLSELYSAHLQGRRPRLPNLGTRYRAYVLWERKRLGIDSDMASVLSRQLKFWTDALAGLPGPIALSLDRPSSTNQRQTNIVRMRVEPLLHSQLVSTAENHQSTLFSVLCAGLSTLLMRFSGATDLLIGTAVPRRDRRNMENTVGSLSNVVVLRLRPSGNLTFSELLAQTRTAELAAHNNQDFPFGRLVELLQPECPAGRHPCFQVSLAVNNTDIGSLSLQDLKVNLQVVDTALDDLDLQFEFTEHYSAENLPAGIQGTVRYRSDLFEHHAIQAMINEFGQILKAAASDPSRRLEDLIIAERDRLLSEWNDVMEQYSSQGTSPNETDRDTTAVERKSPRDSRTAVGYKPLHSSLQHQVAMIWESLLGVDRVGVEDDFFDLGGTPALAERMLDDVERMSGQVLSVPLSPPLTIEQLSQSIMQQRKPAVIRQVQAGNATLKKPFFFLHGDFGGAGIYTVSLARETGEDQPFYVVEPHGLNGSEIPSSIEEMAWDQLKAIREVSPKGPYYLGGNCFGGLIAFEVARRLHEQQEEVALLLLIDATHRGGDDAPPARPVLRSNPPSGWMNSPGMRNAWAFAQYLDAMKRYRPKWFPGKVAVFTSTGYPSGGSDVRRVWSKIAAEADYHWIAGNRITCITRHVRGLAAEMRSCLNRALAAAGAGAERQPQGDEAQRALGDLAPK